MCVDFVVTNHGGCARTVITHEQSLNHVIQFHVKIVLLVTEIFVLYSGKSDLLLAFTHSLSGMGVILSEIRKSGCGLCPHLKRGAGPLGAKPPV